MSIPANITTKYKLVLERFNLFLGAKAKSIRTDNMWYMIKCAKVPIEMISHCITGNLSPGVKLKKKIAISQTGQRKCD
jgi:hypothetical protein